MMKNFMDDINVNIVVFSNGDQVICVLKELFDGDDENKKGICLLMIHPYKLSVVNTVDDLQVQFSKWCPYSTDVQFKIPYGSVVSIGQSNKDLALAYLDKVRQVDSSFGDPLNSENNTENE